MCGASTKPLARGWFLLKLHCPDSTVCDSNLILLHPECDLVISRPPKKPQISSQWISMGSSWLSHTSTRGGLGEE